MTIPIVDADCNIVGWTDVPPVVERNRLRHPTAERLLGGPIFCTEIGLTDPREAAQAGAPRGWRKPWRCLALCGDERLASLARFRRFVDRERAATKSAAGPKARRRAPSPA
jgi:hypothetical protein